MGRHGVELLKWVVRSPPPPSPLLDASILISGRFCFRVLLYLIQNLSERINFSDFFLSLKILHVLITKVLSRELRCLFGNLACGHCSFLFVLLTYLFWCVVCPCRTGDWIEVMKDCNALIYYGLEDLFSYLASDRLLPVCLNECQLLLMLDRVQSYPSYKRVSKENVNKS